MRCVLGRAEDALLKGVPNAAEAMRRVVAKYNTVELVVRGVPKARLVEFEKSLRTMYPTPGRLHCRPYSPNRTTIVEDVSSAWIVLQPSIEEGFGLVALEALAIGTPVLVGHRSGVAEVFHRIDNEIAQSVVVASTQPSDWASAIERVLIYEVDESRAVATALAGKVRQTTSWDDAATEVVRRALLAPHRVAHAAVRTLVDEFRDASTPLRRVRRTIDGRWIPRQEYTEIDDWLHRTIGDGDDAVLLLVGGPGTGKSAIFGRIVEGAEAEGVPILGIKADFVPVDVDGPEKLRAHLGLTRPIVESLRRAIAMHGRGILAIDQLDALCEVVDSRTARLNTLLNLLRAASEIDGVRIVVSVRPFELQHEARLRFVQHMGRVVTLPGLTRTDIEGALPGVNLPDALPEDLLTPHALDVLVKFRMLDLAHFHVPGSAGELRETFWRACTEGDPAREAGARDLAGRLGNAGALWVHVTDNTFSEALAALETRGLLQRTDDGRLGFRHQTLFELARARTLMDDHVLAEFILGSQDQLDVRPLVRSALVHLRVAHTTEYQRLVQDMWTHPAVALHLRFLLVDVVADVDTPSRFEEQTLAKAVTHPTTRRRALCAIAWRPGWFGPLDARIRGWLVEFPRESHLLAVGLMRVRPAATCALLEQIWLPIDERADQLVEVIASQEVIDTDLDGLVGKMIPRLVRDTRYVVPRIGGAIARVSELRAASFYLSCIEEELRLVQAGDTASTELGAFEAVLELPNGGALALDRIEQVFVAASAQSPEQYDANRDRYLESTHSALSQLLSRLAAGDPGAVLARARTIPPHSPLEVPYLATLSTIRGHASMLATWVSERTSRLEHDPESSQFLRLAAPLFDERGTRDVDDAIEHVVVRKGTGDADPAYRRSVQNSNRAYRLFLRSLLVQNHRATNRIAFDEGERHQLEAFTPRRGIRGGLIGSPMSKAQLALAGDDAVLRALAVREPWGRDRGSRLVGDGRQVLGELGHLAEEEPLRVLRIVRKLLDEGRKDEARQLIPAVAEHHNDVAEIEQVTLSLFAEAGCPLDEDADCARALIQVASRAPLSKRAIEQALSRIELAGAIAPEEPIADNEKRVLFQTSFGGGVILPGAYHWLSVFVQHYAQIGSMDASSWTGAVLAALRADPRADTWRMVLDIHASNWWALGRDEAHALLLEIERRVPHRRVTASLTRLYARLRFLLEPGDVEMFVRRTLQRGCFSEAAELMAFMSTEPNGQWAGDLLAEALDHANVPATAASVLACVGDLMGEPDRREALSVLGSVWIPKADAKDLQLLFVQSAEEGWFADGASALVLANACARIAEMDAEALGRLVSLLERFVEYDPMFVLDATEHALARALELDQLGSQPTTAECLSLSFALRFALPNERVRVHAVFERALQADSYAATIALSTIDGPAVPSWPWIHGRLRMRPSRRRLRGTLRSQ